MTDKPLSEKIIKNTANGKPLFLEVQDVEEAVKKLKEVILNLYRNNAESDSYIYNIDEIFGDLSGGEPDKSE